MKITLLNIDDVIRKEKRENPQKKLSFLWGEKEFYILRNFVHLEKDSKQGVTYMGVKHYWDFKKKGYSVSYEGI